MSGRYIRPILLLILSPVVHAINVIDLLLFVSYVCMIYSSGVAIVVLLKYIYNISVFLLENAHFLVIDTNCIFFLNIQHFDTH